MPVESGRSGRGGSTVALRIGLLGPLTVIRGDVPLKLPASRKVRALLAYLALAPRPVARSQLCELLWDVPNDPRGELRWCLSKLRSIVDDHSRRRVDTSHDAIRLDLTDCAVDAIEIVRATEEGIGTLTPERHRAPAGLFEGVFREGLEDARRAAFTRGTH